MLLELHRRNDRECFEDVEDGGALEGRAARDGVEASRVAVALARALGDVQRDRQGGAAKLIGERSVPAGHTFCQARSMAEEQNRAAVDIEALETEHAAPIGRMTRAVASGEIVSVSVSVYDHVHVHVYVHAAR
jgi:hypothetical protein